MNDQPDNDGLLKDVLGDFAARRDALLADTLRHVRRRRRLRQARPAVFVIAIALLAMLLVNMRRQQPPIETHLAPPKPSPYVLVETQPLRPAALVETRILSPAMAVSTVPTAGIVTTEANKFHLEEVTDETLLAMAAPNPAVLVRRANGQAELVFVDSDGDSAE